MFRKTGVKVRDHMVKRPVVVNPETELFAAIHKILVHKISGVTVVDENKNPVGILSELDCLRVLTAGEFYTDDHREEKHPGLLQDPQWPFEPIGPTVDPVEHASFELADLAVGDDHRHRHDRDGRERCPHHRHRVAHGMSNANHHRPLR
jgi:CBS domain containing-hemolysin-like protein